MPQTTSNKALWLSSFESPLDLKDLPVPEAGSGSVVVRNLATLITPYTHAVHTGKLPQLNIHLPLVPNPGSIASIHSIGPDAIHLEVGDLVFVDSTIAARDNRDVIIMQGHHGGEGEQGLKLMQGEWRDGALQQFQKVPLENCYFLDKKSLYGNLKYTPAELVSLPLYSVAAGALFEAADLKAAETIVIGPAGGSFGGAAVELALALSANVIALGRDESKIAAMKRKLGNPHRLSYVVLKGDVEKDAAAILKATPGGVGADVYNDWTPGVMENPPYLAPAILAMKREGRVILSGGASGAAQFPYAYAVHKNLTIKGKWMCNRTTLERVIGMVTLGLLNIGKSGGAEVATFDLEDHEAAVEHAKETGVWRKYTVITPTQDD